MDTTDPIRQVSVVSTGQVQIRPDHLASTTSPGVGSRRGLRDPTAMINTMRQRDPGLVILPAHDPGAAGRLAQATGLAPILAIG